MQQSVGALSVRLHGAWENRALDYDASVLLQGDVVRIAYNQSTSPMIEFAVHELTGAVFRDDTLTLHLRGGAPVVLSASPHLDGLRNRLEALVCTFPAQTLSLRGFGSERSAPGSDHDRWFEALLLARRVAEESRTVETQRRAFDASRLSRHAQTTRETFAKERHTAPADQRALNAELELLGSPYALTMRALEQAGLELRHAPESAQFDVWRAWVECVQKSFRAADDVWTAMVPVLCDSRGVKGTFWRRLVNKRGDSAR